MSQHHVARCDGPKCKVEVALIPVFDQNNFVLNSGNGQSYLPSPRSYTVPEKWLKAENREFCTWQCMAAFAESMVETCQSTA